MPYVIKLCDTTHQRDGSYVSQPGSRHTYTANLLHARRFQSREAAEAQACGNEMVIDFDAMLRDCSW
jgi:hypothetical protein